MSDFEQRDSSTESLSWAADWVNERREQHVKELREIEKERAQERAKHTIGDDKVIWLDEPLAVGETILDSGVFKTKRCIPDRTGEYHAYREVAQPIAEYGTAITNISYDYERISCPRFRKCEECPNLIGSPALGDIDLDLED